MLAIILDVKMLRQKTRQPWLTKRQKISRLNRTSNCRWHQIPNSHRDQILNSILHLSQIKAIEFHDFHPCGDKISDKLLLRIFTRIDFCQGAQF
jgi:hypothetical protein